jgi:hypothetical protein
MLWKLFHKLFGWEYAVVFDLGDKYGTVRRIHTAKNGDKFFRKGIYGLHSLTLYNHLYLT